jgi:branched-chain amino acid transport system substrate-binding protein
MRVWLISSVVMIAGCASGGTTIEPPQPETPEAHVVWERVLDRSALDRADEALEDGNRGTGAVIADSLTDAWLGNSDLDPESADDLVDLLERVGDEDRAAHLLFRAPFDLDGGARKRLRGLVTRLSIDELDLLLDDGAGRADARSIVAAELARALALANRSERSRLLAEQVLAGSPDGTERDKAEDVIEGKVLPIQEPVRVGVVLPASGRFAEVGEQILEGALLALTAYESDPSNSRVELVVLDDSSSVDIGIDLVESLAKSSVVAVLGPVRTEALVSAAIRRDEDDLALVSPTATGGQGAEPDAYSLWDRDRREADVATTIVSWLSEKMDLNTFGVLYPSGWSPVALAALGERVNELGGRIVASESYAADSTTFGAPITALAAAEPEAVVVFSDRPRTVLQLAPQLVYYGLRRWVTAGDVNWSDPEVLRRLEPSYADYRLVGLFVDRLSPGTPWQAFKAQFEARYRKALLNNMFAALGFDAMALILKGVPEAEVERRGAVGRSIRRGVHQGATGALSVDRRTGELRRDVYIRVIREGELRIPDTDEMLQWAQEQLELEEFLKALEDEKESEEATP